MAFAAWDWPPFDILGDTLRGTRNILADMRRRPGKLHDALEVATKIFIEYGSGRRGRADPVHLDLGPQVDARVHVRCAVQGVLLAVSAQGPAWR